MKTLEENNRMIAEFMNVRINENDTFELPQHGYITASGIFKTEFYANKLKYHYSWDWLMPVVEKIDNLETDEEFTENMGDITHALIDINIDELYYQVCLFIEKYNKQQIGSN